MTPTKRVLLAEDDDDLRSAMTASLEAAGFEVVGLPDGADAMDYIDDGVLFDAPKPRIHALVTDLGMPGMSGQQLLDHLDELGHGLPTVVVTGMEECVAVEVARRPDVSAVLRKPFKTEDLRRALRAVLAQAKLDASDDTRRSGA